MIDEVSEDEGKDGDDEVLKDSLIKPTKKKKATTAKSK